MSHAVIPKAFRVANKTNGTKFSVVGRMEEKSARFLSLGDPELADGIMTKVERYQGRYVDQNLFPFGAHKERALVTKMTT